MRLSIFKRKLYIYGMGGLGREAYDIACRIKNKSWKKIGFIDDNASQSSLTFLNVEVISFDELSKKKNIDIVIAIGEPATRKILYERIKKTKFNIVSLIDPSTTISRFAHIEKGCVICPNTVISSNVSISENVYINANSFLGHDTSVAKHVVFAPNVTVGGNVSFGEESFVGSGAKIKELVTIGRKVVIAMGSVVKEDIQDENFVAGNPARISSRKFLNKVFK